MIDSLEFSLKITNQLLIDFNLPIFDVPLKNYNYHDFRRHLEKYMDFSNHELVDMFVELYKHELKEDSLPFDGIGDVLKELENRGKTLAICTNREEDDLKLRMEMFPDLNFKYLSGFRPGVPNKPDSYRVNEVIEKEGIEKEKVILFGDKANDIFAAKNAGIDIAFVRWGQGVLEDFKDPYIYRIWEHPEDILDI